MDMYLNLITGIAIGVILGLLLSKFLRKNKSPDKVLTEKLNDIVDELSQIKYDRLKEAEIQTMTGKLREIETLCGIHLKGLRSKVDFLIDKNDNNPDIFNN